MICNTFFQGLLSGIWVMMAIIGGWMILNAILPYVSGWKALARLYPSDKIHYGKTHRVQNFCIGKASYRRIVRYVTTPKGVYFSLYRIFNIGSAPIFIPWGSMTVKEQRCRKFWGNDIVVEVENFNKHLVFPRNIAEILLDTCPPESLPV